jgi:hypothetical protein
MFLRNFTTRRGGNAHKRSRKGAVAILALVIALVGAILFQAYLTHVLSDIKTSGEFDTVSQYEGERRAIGNLVKESVLQYYECPRLNVGVTSVQKTLEAYLAAMKMTNITYSVDTMPALPSNAEATFWVNLSVDGDSDGEVMEAGDSETLGTGFKLKSELLPDILSKSRIAQYIPDPDNVLSIQTDALDDVFTFVITRTDSNTNTEVIFTYYVRMFQVPVTDYNLVAYAMADTTADIVDKPPTLSTTMVDAIKDGDISALCLSKMADDSAITKISLAASTSYPYSYRELFSAGNGVWEWVFYDDEYIGQYFPTNTGNGVYLVNLSTTPSEETVTVDGVSYADEYGTTGFTPAYYNTNSPSGRVSCNGYPETCDAATGYPTGFTNWSGTAITDQDGDGAVTELDASIAGVVPKVPTKVLWKFDLNKISTLGTATERRIYIKLPEDALPSTKSTITLTDSTVSGVDTAGKVVICIEGWKRYNNNKADITNAPENYTFYLGDATTATNLTDQQILLFAVGANIITPSDGTTMNGAILLDDRLSGFPASNKLTLNGLFAWSGGGNTSASVKLDGLTVNKLAVANYFRKLAPRYLLVNVQSSTKIVK